MVSTTYIADSPVCFSPFVGEGQAGQFFVF